MTAAVIVLPQLPFTAFAADTEFEYTVISEKNKTIAITSVSDTVTALEIPSKIDGYTVTEIGSRAFFGCYELTDITLPDTITAIGDNAFTGCLSLKEIVLPDSVESLGNNCFMSCTALDYAYLGESLKEIPENCFYSCTALSRIYIPETTEKIGDNAFFVCADLSGIYIPASVSEIGENAVGRRYDRWSDSVESMSGFIIRGESGTAAEAYALEFGFDFIFGRTEKGDVNGDGVTDAIDASAVLTEYAGTSTGKAPTFAAWQEEAGDWNLDGVVDAIDASAILTYYAKMLVQ